jgi:hypothetical protein
MKKLVKFYVPLINWPNDWQGRLYINEKRIRWDGKVHEKIIGHKKYTFLPETEDFCIYHIKSITKQEQQNQFYETM